MQRWFQDFHKSLAGVFPLELIQSLQAATSRVGKTFQARQLLVLYDFKMQLWKLGRSALQQRRARWLFVLSHCCRHQNLAADMRLDCRVEAKERDAGG